MIVSVRLTDYEMSVVLDLLADLLQTGPYGSISRKADQTC